MKTIKISELKKEDPVLLNCWKHHAGFIKLKILYYRGSGKFDFISFRENLLRIGDSLMDLYLGELSPEQISGKIKELFAKQDITDRDKFIFWLKQERKDYREVYFNDNSIWTLRLGLQPEKYIHIHPSRYSPHTKRVRAITLKTAILYLILNDTNQNLEDKVLFVNKIRMEYLNQPPLKMISSKSTLPELVSILGQ
ncbi:MAG TPA: hypothetical protein VLB50_03885 [Ignavibacteriaceae bacterium]|nr:hypothetical protein [Ignavibacteriaceae bacterium]